MCIVWSLTSSVSQAASETRSARVVLEGFGFRLCGNAQPVRSGVLSLHAKTDLFGCFGRKRKPPMRDEEDACWPRFKRRLRPCAEKIVKKIKNKHKEHSSRLVRVFPSKYVRRHPGANSLRITKISICESRYYKSGDDNHMEWPGQKGKGKVLEEPKDSSSAHSAHPPPALVIDDCKQEQAQFRENKDCRESANDSPRTSSAVSAGDDKSLDSQNPWHVWVVVVILGCLTFSDRLLAVACTCVWWYLIPRVKATGSGSTATDEPQVHGDDTQLLDQSHGRRAETTSIGDVSAQPNRVVE